MSGFRGAVSFLTRIRADRGDGAAEVASALPWFPVVGAVVGGAVAGAYGLGVLVWPPLVASAVAVGVGAILTGALHEDGLADTADALGARSPEDARRILADPAHGTYGLLALVLASLVRVGALASLGPGVALAWVPSAHALSRAAAVRLLSRPTAGAGLGAGTAAHADRGRLGAALVAGLAVAAAAIGPWAVPAGLAVVAASALVGRVAARRLGGVGGDAVGAAQQLGEVLVLLLASAAAAGEWPLTAWWR